MNERHDGLDNEDMRKWAHHGKDISDANMAAVGGMVANLFHDDYGGGAQHWCGSRQPHQTWENAIRCGPRQPSGELL